MFCYLYSLLSLFLLGLSFARSRISRPYKSCCSSVVHPIWIFLSLVRRMWWLGGECSWKWTRRWWIWGRPGMRRTSWQYSDCLRISSWFFQLSFLICWFYVRRKPVGWCCWAGHSYFWLSEALSYVLGRDHFFLQQQCTLWKLYRHFSAFILFR